MKGGTKFPRQVNPRRQAHMKLPEESRGLPPGPGVSLVSGTECTSLPAPEGRWGEAGNGEKKERTLYSHQYKRLLHKLWLAKDKIDSKEIVHLIYLKKSLGAMPRNTTCFKVKMGKENGLGDFHPDTQPAVTEHLLWLMPALSLRAC